MDSNISEILSYLTFKFIHFSLPFFHVHLGNLFQLIHRLSSKEYNLIRVFHKMEEQGHNRSPLSNSNHISPSGSYPSPASQLVDTEETGETEVHIQPEDHLQPSNDYRRHQLRFASYRFSFAASNFGFNDTRDDVWSCLVVLSTFWFFASMTLILGFYGSFNLQLGPNCSYMIEANPIFVHSIKAQQLPDQTEGPMLYGFHKSPPLDVKTTWSQNHTASLKPNYHDEWAYYLNAGSQINISLDVKFPSSTPLTLVIAQGRETLLEWIDYPTYANTTLSWKIIYGSGNISLDIKHSDIYFVAVGNLNSKTVGVDLNITIQSVLYNTSKAYFKCSLNNHVCSFSLHLLRPNAAVLTSPRARQVKDDDGWYFKVSFGPQWVTYIGGSCITTVLILALIKLCNKFQSNSEGQAGQQWRESRGQREPLLSPKGDDCSSQGSSYDSVTNNEEEDLEENLLEASIEGKAPREGDQAKTNTRHMCVICFDAPRDCFFIPCGHCATCFTCGSRIAEEAGTCPICRRKMKKVRKIFAV